jgi:hypothetical protein
VITASPIRPAKIQRESRTRVSSYVNPGTMVDVAETPPWFSFVEWGERPGDYVMGRWDRVGSQLVATTGVIGMDFVLEPGVYSVYLKVGYGAEEPVLAVGRLTIA